MLKKKRDEGKQIKRKQGREMKRWIREMLAI